MHAWQAFLMLIATQKAAKLEPDFSLIKCV